MEVLLGIDLGTTGVKGLLVDEEGKVVDSETQEYPLIAPRPGWAEQDPLVWKEKSLEAIRRLCMRNPGKRIEAVGLTGQMHGLVMLDGRGEVIRPAILWCDQRTSRESEEIHRIFGHQNFVRITGNPALTGFTAPKILWVKKEEPDNFSRVAKILLPKDYLRFVLTGEFFSDVSDASGTSLFDVAKRRWSEEVVKGLGIRMEWLPEVRESCEVAGRITREVSRVTGLPEGIPVVAGAGDQAASAFGCGIVREGVLSLTLGTSGVVFCATDTMKREEEGRLHSFCHAVRGKWHLMGVMLSAGGSFRWWRDNLGEWEKSIARREGVDPYEVLTREAGESPPGAEGVVFLPYLAGERTPHQDPFARGVFFGISLATGRSHLIRSVLEGIGFGLKDSLELMKGMGLGFEEVRIVGGGARSELWRRILASILELPLLRLEVEEGSSYGAALLAGVGGGVFQDEEEVEKLVRVREKTQPVEDWVDIYRRIYPLFKELYGSLKERFRELNSILEG